MKPDSKPSNYQPQMDGLRAVAVVFVMIHHFEATIPQWINWGTLGVRFFFVLSGFLITRILLRSRDRCDDGKAGWWSEFANFQMRRFIRTLPPYYMSLGLGVALGLPMVLHTLGWTLPFLTNFLIIKTGYFPYTVSHFWSLAVQEQFYMVWPWLIFFLPKSWFKWMFLGLILGGVVFRYGCILFHASDVFRWVSLFASLDTFAVGGILAWWSMTHPKLIDRTETRVWSGILALALICAARQMRSLPLENPWTVVIELFEALFMGWVVACAVTGFRGLPGRVLSWEPLTYIGRISYGIYVYHIMVVIMLNPWLTKWGMIHIHNQRNLSRFAIQVLVACTAASLSWHFFEKPMLLARDRIADWFRKRSQKAVTAESKP